MPTRFWRSTRGARRTMYGALVMGTLISCDTDRTALIEPGDPSPGNPRLSITKAGTGAGTVASAPDGIDCGVSCSNTFTVGSVVVLIATPTQGSRFAGWSGGGCSGTDICSVPFNATGTVAATFNLVLYPFSVTRTGTGSGTVTSSVTGINCGGDCSEPFIEGTTVTLTARADGASVFGGWSGGNCTGTDTCEVKVTQATAVTAIFNAITPRWPDSFTAYCRTGGVIPTCPGGPAGQDGAYQVNVPNYVIFGGSVQDAITGLVWERQPTVRGLDWAASMSYCDNLTLDGATDWRLPSELELLSIVDFGRPLAPFPPAIFPGVPSNSYYWSASSWAPGSSFRVVFSTTYGTTNTRTTTTATNEQLVRCVRGMPIAGAIRSVGGDIEDGATHLTWQSTTAPAPLNWEDALAYCEGLTLNGHSDWRLPNAKELGSIVDRTRLAPMISTMFAVRPSTIFWSSSPYPSTQGAAFTINFSVGVSGSIFSTKLAELYDVRCVR